MADIKDQMIDDLTEAQSTMWKALSGVLEDLYQSAPIPEGVTRLDFFLIVCSDGFKHNQRSFDYALRSGKKNAGIPVVSMMSQIAFFEALENYILQEPNPERYQESVRVALESINAKTNSQEKSSKDQETEEDN